jgi:D-aminoacyl-tRNA deacylase
MINLNKKDLTNFKHIPKRDTIIKRIAKSCLWVMPDQIISLHGGTKPASPPFYKMPIMKRQFLIFAVPLVPVSGFCYVPFMRTVIQRVSQSSVTINRKEISHIGPGLLILLGVGQEDTLKDADHLAEKIINLRIFEDDAGKMNLSVLEKRGEILVVSQFTLFGDCRKGRRPSFIGAAKPESANSLYEYFVSVLRIKGITVKTGVFQAMMEVSLVNDGPVTFFLDSRS